MDQIAIKNLILALGFVGDSAGKVFTKKFANHNNYATIRI